MSTAKYRISYTLYSRYLLGAKKKYDFPRSGSKGGSASTEFALPQEEAITSSIKSRYSNLERIDVKITGLGND
jgi:hypothetical protein